MFSNETGRSRSSRLQRARVFALPPYENSIGRDNIAAAVLPVHPATTTMVYRVVGNKQAELLLIQ